MGQRTGKKLAAGQRRYKDHHDRRTHATVSFRAGQWVYFDCPSVDVTAADRLATASYSKLLPCKLGLYGILSSTTETVMINGEGMPNTISCYRASLGQQSEIDASATEASASHQFKFLERSLGKHSATDLPISTIDSQS